MLFRDINSLEVSNPNKECVKSRLRDSAYTPLEQVSKISEESLSKEEVKALNNLVKTAKVISNQSFIDGLLTIHFYYFDQRITLRNLEIISILTT